MAKNHPMGTIETRVDSRMSQSVDLDYPVAAASALPKVPWRPHCARVPTPRVFDRRKKLPFLFILLYLMYDSYGTRSPLQIITHVIGFDL